MGQTGHVLRGGSPENATWGSRISTRPKNLTWVCPFCRLHGLLKIQMPRSYPRLAESESPRAFPPRPTPHQPDCTWEAKTVLLISVPVAIPPRPSGMGGGGCEDSLEQVLGHRLMDKRP